MADSSRELSVLPGTDPFEHSRPELENGGERRAFSETLFRPVDYSMDMVFRQYNDKAACR